MQHERGPRKPKHNLPTKESNHHHHPVLIHHTSAPLNSVEQPTSKQPPGIVFPQPINPHMHYLQSPIKSSQELVPSGENFVPSITPIPPAPPSAAAMFLAHHQPPPPGLLQILMTAEKCQVRTNFTKHKQFKIFHLNHKSTLLKEINVFFSFSSI